MLARQSRNSADVIVVLVRYDDRGEIFGAHAKTGQASRRICEAESAIQKNARAARLHQQGIALTAAAEGSKAHFSARGTRRESASRAAVLFEVLLQDRENARGR